MSKKIPLINYTLIIQYLENNKDNEQNLVTKTEVYDTYKEAKKFSKVLGKSLISQNKKIIKITISPSLLEETISI